MELKEALEQALRQNIARPEDADRARQVAELLGEYLRLEDRVSSVLGGEGRQEAERAGDLAGRSLDVAAERVLEDAGVPLHVRELGARIKARGWRHPRSKHARPDQIMFQLAARLPRQPDRFRRVAPNTFALSSWNDTAAQENRRRPRVSIFRSGGGVSGREIGERDEPVSDERSTWRSS